MNKCTIDGREAFKNKNDFSTSILKEKVELEVSEQVFNIKTSSGTFLANTVLLGN
jgi:hypothetical protein